jgi:hypothetical protein
MNAKEKAEAIKSLRLYKAGQASPELVKEIETAIDKDPEVAALWAEVKAAPMREGMVRVKAVKHVCVSARHIFPGKEGEITEKEFKALGGLVEKVGVILMLGALLLFGGHARAQQYTAQPLLVNGGTTNEFKLNGQPTYTNLTENIVLNPGTTNQFTLYGFTNACTSLNTIAAGSASNYNAVITVTKWDYIGMAISAKLMATGSLAITAVFDSSADSTNWILATDVLTANAQGTTLVTFGTNYIFAGSFGYKRLSYVTNASNATLTNLAVVPTLKPRRAG